MAEGWQTVASLPPLGAEELQVWRIDLGDAGQSEDTYRAHLSRVEHDRADRLRAGQVRMQFIVARAGLRVLLGNILRLPPVAVPILLDAYGKPETSAVNGRALFFNVAHSRETILIALCRESRVGIDLEYLDRETDVLEVARASFTAAECRQIEEAADPVQRSRAFFRCWTRKEAVVKADGRGLSLPLTTFEVPVLAPARGALVHVVERAEGRGLSANWFVSDLALGNEIAGAVAVSNNRLRPETFHLPLGALHAAR